ncbi:hypothetical protein [Rhodanobacter umsongensis]
MQLILPILHAASGLLRRLLWIFSGRLVASAPGTAALRPMPVPAKQLPWLLAGTAWWLVRRWAENLPRSGGSPVLPAAGPKEKGGAFFTPAFSR